MAQLGNRAPWMADFGNRVLSGFEDFGNRILAGFEDFGNRVLDSKIWKKPKFRI